MDRGLSASLAWVAIIAAAAAGSAGARAAAQTANPTFTKDVAPIVFQHCAACHRAGGPAPFRLLDYADVAKRASQVVAATQKRLMPPWLPEPGHGEFANDRRLSDAQIETIRRWVELGMPEGVATDLPAFPRFAEGWQLGEPDLVLRLPQPYVLPARGADVMRNFVIPIPLSETRYVRAVELRPGSATFVHHALMQIDQTSTSRRRDVLDAEPGFDGMELGGAHMPDGHLIGWTPGMVPFRGIEGMPWRLDPGTDLVLQAHMVPSGNPEIVAPLIGLYFADKPAARSPMYLLRLDADEDLDIPAGEEDFVVADTFQLPVDVEVLAIYPHAHYLGKTVQGWATLPDGATERLIRIDRWDFDWQDGYRYARPIPLPKGTSIGMRWSYDNSAANPHNRNHPPLRVVAGNQSSDEMAQMQFQVRLKNTEDLAVLQEFSARHALKKNPGNIWGYYSLGNALWQQRRLADAAAVYREGLKIGPDHAAVLQRAAAAGAPSVAAFYVATHNNLGAVLVRQGETAEAIEHFRRALDLDRDFADIHYNMGDALRVEGKIPEAIDAYRAALKLEPGLASAHSSLGQVLGARGQVDEALVHFREAVRLNPDSADDHNNIGAMLGLQGKVDEAAGQFRRALEIDPSHEKARLNLERAIAKASP
jgi:tetratricopeptide (TPR) repeat protein/mono/diheme cytochrome c family protein